MTTDILIVGGGIAGLAAAKEASAGGASVLLADHTDRLGGVLPQCTHRGFAGTLTGPEYLQTQLEDFPKNVDIRLSTTVLSVDENRQALLSSAKDGVYTVTFGQVILATGCREIPAGALPLGGTRPKGIYTAGQAQNLCNLHGVTLPDPIAILGSGDLGLIMAAQLAGRGQKIAAVIEQKPHCGGLARNRHCLREFSIPLHLNTTVRRIEGYPQLCGVWTEENNFIPCKTLLIAAGLQPEQTLIQNLGNPAWLHLCGNCRRLHTMAESVAAEGKQAATAACNGLRGKNHER